MIHFRDVTKYYRARDGLRVVLDQVSCDFESGHNYGILGANGAGKSTLVRMISGAEPPNRGRIHRRVRVSFPLGFSGTFNGYLTGRQNAVFLARVYGENVRKVLDFVWDFAELGTYFDMPLNTYSSGMRARFGMAVSLSIEFDLYLIDEATEVGDAHFRAKTADAFRDRVHTSDMILVSHNVATIRKYCDRAAVLNDGKIEFFPTVDQAIGVHTRYMRQRHGE